MTDVPAHDQPVLHRYALHYPDHEPRVKDPHYKDFHHWREQHKADAKCQFGVDRGGDFSECDPGPDQWPDGLEVHHSEIEFALQNEVDLGLLERKYPGVSNPDEVGEWVESGDNLMWLCGFHHRGHAGVHVASASDFTAEHFVRKLIS
jgi:hypothetical protein